MRTNRIIAAITSGSLFLGSVAAFAQAERNQELLDQRQRDQQRGNAPEGRPTENHGGREAGPAPRTHGDQRYDPRYYQRYDNKDQRFYPGDRAGGDWQGRGAGPNHDWYRGSRLPREYNSRNYVVDDWRAHHLSPPPSGYHWVQSGGDYVLAAIATGVIAAILLNQ
ncbi:MAG TPA: RcnB family protein [Caldimonas sp.]|jgi:Ni/Co efflux regulator RcnB|nr:RcnB family protein [Caldimonas sp.]HEX4235153.1 RcnB family protein [Caldimonas sp.]